MTNEVIEKMARVIRDEYTRAFMSGVIDECEIAKAAYDIAREDVLRQLESDEMVDECLDVFLGAKYVRNQDKIKMILKAVAERMNP